MNAPLHVKVHTASRNILDLQPSYQTTFECLKYLYYICYGKEINVLLKILTYTNVVVLMFAEVGVCMTYFSQNSQNICSKIQ